MKRIGQSKIVNIAISFVIAILLSSYVLSTKSATSTTNNPNNFTTLIPEKKASLKVALNLQFDNDKYVVIGAPATVQVDIEGSGALVSAAQSRNDIQASADLRSLKPGKHIVTVALRGVNASLTSTVNPQKVSVTIAEKTATTLPVSVSYDKSEVAKGYTASDPTATPKSVTISGPKTNVDAVATIAAHMSLPSGTKSSLTQTVKLVPLDKNGREVEVNLGRQNVDATITISPEDSKKVALAASIKNGDSKNYQVTFDPKNVTVYGSSDILNAMNSINVTVDVADIKDKGSVQLKLPQIDGIVRYDTDTVTATVSQINSSSNNSSASTSGTSESLTSESSESTTSSSSSNDTEASSSQQGE